MNNSILFIDDYMEDIESFRLWIEPKYKMLVAGNAKDGIRTLKENLDQISVVVVDMKLEDDEDDLMPDSGLRLVKKIKELAERIPIIVLTGYYDNPYLKDCIEAGAMIYVLKAMKNTRDLLLSFIEKADKEFAERKKMSSLSSEFDALRQNHEKLSRMYSNEIKVGKWFGRESIGFEVLEIIPIESNSYIEDDWRTLYEISIGESLEIAETIELEVNHVVEQVLSENTKTRIKSQLGTAIVKQLEAEFQSNQSLNQKDMRQEKIKVSQSIKKVLTLSEPTSYEDRHVLKRKYEYTPVYNKYLAKIRMSCSACGISRVAEVIYYEPVKRLATRLTNHFNDGTMEVA